MAKATIRTKSGAVISIEGNEREVADILTRFDTTAVVGQAKEAVARARAVKNGEKKRSFASDLITQLKEDDFFQKPRGLGDIAKALEERGYIYPITTLSGVVLGLVQRRILGRKKLDGRWVYGK